MRFCFGDIAGGVVAECFVYIDGVMLSLLRRSRIFDAPSTRTPVVKKNWPMWIVRIGIGIGGGCCWRFQVRFRLICIRGCVLGRVCAVSFIIISIESRLRAQICYAFYLSCFDSSCLAVCFEQSIVEFVFCYGHVFERCVVC